MSANPAGTINRLVGGLDIMERRLRTASDQGRLLSQSFTDLQHSAMGANNALSTITQLGVPTVFKTLTDSIELVVMKLGYHLIPPLLAAAQYVQEFGDWIDQSSDGVKTFVQWLAIAAASITAFVIAVKIASVAMTIGAMFGPIGQIIGGVIAAGAGLAAAGAAGYATHQLFKGPSRDKKLLTHYQTEMTPQIVSLEQARKNLQLGALKDPLEMARIEQQRRAANAVTNTIPGLLEDIRRNGNGLR